jgi:hypothetical protein
MSIDSNATQRRRLTLFNSLSIQRRFAASLAMIVVLASALQAEAAFAGWATLRGPKSCEEALSTVDPLDAAIQGNDLRQKILSRRRFPGDIEFEVPEYRPFVLALQNELKELSLRLKASKPESLSRNYDRFVRVPLQMFATQWKVDRMATGPIVYWDVLTAAYEFNQMVDRIHILEGKLQLNTQSESDNSWYRHMFANLKLFAMNYPVLIVPSIKSRPYSAFNLTWSKGILTYGVSSKINEVHEMQSGGLNFGTHDCLHIMYFIGALSKTVDPSIKISDDFKSVTTENYRRMDLLLSETSGIVDRFFMRVNQLENKDQIRAIHYAFFAMDHEIERAFEKSQSAITVSDVSAALERFKKEEPNRIPKGLTENFYDPFWIEIKNTISDLWAQARLLK